MSKDANLHKMVEHFEMIEKLMESGLLKESDLYNVKIQPTREIPYYKRLSIYNSNTEKK